MTKKPAGAGATVVKPDATNGKDEESASPAAAAKPAAAKKKPAAAAKASATTNEAVEEKRRESRPQKVIVTSLSLSLSDLLSPLGTQRETDRRSRMAKVASGRESSTQSERQSLMKIKDYPWIFFSPFKLWNARLAGYEECGKVFSLQDSSKSGEFEDYLDLLPRFAMDANENAREKGLEALLVFVQEAHVART